MNEFFEQLVALSGQSRQAFLTAFLVFLRVGAVMALMPGFGEQMVPARIRLILALAFTAIVYPVLADRLTPPEALHQWLAEVVIGLMLGAGLRLFIHGLQIAGTIIAQSVSLSQLLGGVDNEPSPAIGSMLTMAGLALAMAMGLHVKVAQLLILSYDLLPAGLMPEPGTATTWGVALIARMFTLAFSLAAPFMIAALVYNLALGVINRAMPQLMVAMVGAPALTLGGLALLALAAPLLLAIWAQQFNGWLAAPLGAL